MLFKLQILRKGFAILLISILYPFILWESFAQNQKDIDESLEVDQKYFDLERTGFIPDTLAKYPGGIKGVKHHMAMNVKYPINAAINFKKGRVIISHSVEIDGSINEFVIIQSASKGLDKEVIRTIKKMKVWIPAIKDGKPVKVYYKQTVVFNM